MLRSKNKAGTFSVFKSASWRHSFIGQDYWHQTLLFKKKKVKIIIFSFYQIFQYIHHSYKKY